MPIDIKLYFTIFHVNKSDGQAIYILLNM